MSNAGNSRALGATGAIIFSLLFAPHGAQAQDAADAPSPGMEAVAFMVGCWAQPAPEGNGLREIYSPPATNLMTGLSQFWRGGRIVDFEFHRIDATETGPALTPHPRGQPSVTFPPSVMRPNHITWENLEHDFPQRIMYTRVAPDSLVARIEGGEGEDAQMIEWRMGRIACPAAAPF